MAKSIITGDIHVFSYPKYNHFSSGESDYPTFRLYQFIRLAKYIVEVKKSDPEINRLIIAGDLLLHPVMNSHTSNILSEMFKIITDAGITIEFISGNHDLDLKCYDTMIQNERTYQFSSPLPALHNGINVFYRENEVVTLDGVSFFFHGWVPGNNIPHQSADVLISHGDPEGAFYLELGGHKLKGIDTSSYKLAFLGHDHHPKQIGNCYVPGCPIQHSFSDLGVDTRLLVLDHTDLSVESVAVPDTFLRFYYAEDKSDKDRILSEITTPAAVAIKPKKLSKKAKLENQSDQEKDKHLMTRVDMDLVTTALEFIKPEFTEDTKSSISQVLTDQYDIDYTYPDLDFSFGKVVVNNFGSIRNLELDLTDFSGLISIEGDNGAGKSTLFKFLRYMVFGSLRGYNNDEIATVGESYFYGSLEVNYANHKYYIERTIHGSSASTKFMKDGEWISTNKKTELNKRIMSELGFCYYWSIIEILQESEGIFASMSDTDRVSFLSNFIGMPIIERWTWALGDKINKLKESVTQVNNEISVKKDIDK